MGRGGAGRAGRGAGARSLSLEAGPTAQLTFAGQSSRAPWPGRPRGGSGLLTRRGPDKAV